MSIHEKDNELIWENYNSPRNNLMDKKEHVNDLFSTYMKEVAETIIKECTRMGVYLDWGMGGVTAHSLKTGKDLTNSPTYKKIEEKYKNYLPDSMYYIIYKKEDHMWEFLMRYSLSGNSKKHS